MERQVCVQNHVMHSGNCKMAEAKAIWGRGGEAVGGRGLRSIICQAKEPELTTVGSLEGLEQGCAIYNQICASERSLQ